MTIFSGLASFVFGNNRKQTIGAIVVDCVISDTHTYDSLVTDYPVEDGTYIQDNVWLKPTTYQMKGVISDASIFSVFGAGSSVGSQEALTSLLQLRNQKTLFDIVTSLQIYQNMIFTKFEPMRDKDTGATLTFNAEFKQIKKVTSQTTTINANTNSKSMEQKVNKGQVQTTTAPAKAEKDASDAYKIIYK